jgi:alpha-glucosidase (family GH31 glycosyl hydrolase)
LATLGAAFVIPATAHGADLTIAAGPARATLTDAGGLMFTQRRGSGLTQAGPFRVRRASGRWARAERLTGLRRGGGAILAAYELENGGGLQVRLSPSGSGVFALTVAAPAQSDAVGVSFAHESGEALLGGGERSDAVDRRGRETENYVADGPFRREDRVYVRTLTPPWAERDRDDATYYPVPWLLSTRGWGVLADNDETSRFTSTASAWGPEIEAPTARLRVFAGPTPAQALRRFTAATGRQPAPRAPWAFGPWFQTGQPNVVPLAEEQAITAEQRKAGAPVSVAETQMHYLPCGAHKGREGAERQRTASFHRDGLARLVYLNPLLCVSYLPVYTRALAAGVLQSLPGGLPFAYPAFVGGAAPLGFSVEPLAQFDFTNPATKGFYAGLVREALADGADGWMEDFGESTPPLIAGHDGSTGSAAHNRYPVDYHCTLQRIAAEVTSRPLVRFQRSGWTGSARCADVVWGGDPTTVWGFDGLSSAVTQLLSSGLSGVSRWGTDIGGYNSFGAGIDLKPGATEDERLTRELLVRWIEFGALVPVMRTKRTGLAVPSYTRPQVYDPAQLDVWRRLTELHAQLNAYLRAADDEHRASGLPIARHLALAYPGQARARSTHDEYMLGPSFLAAPVTAPGRRSRGIWLPPGRWVDWWRSVTFEPRSGAYGLGRARVLRGGRQHVLPAPLGEPPLLLKAGALVPLLSADIDTLTGYGREAGLTRLADRAGRLRLLAIPRARGFARLGDGRRALSSEGRGRWRLRLRAPRATTFEIQASLRAAVTPFRPRQVLVNGRPLRRARWRYDRRSGVLRITLRGRRLAIDARR